MSRAVRLHGWNDAVAHKVGLPPCIKEAIGIPGRDFRIDIAYPDVWLAVEIEGGAWSRGRHVRGAGYLKDMEKYNLLTVHGWRLLRYPPDNIRYLQIFDVWRNRRF